MYDTLVDMFDESLPGINKRFFMIMTISEKGKEAK